jgi:hypothetical protein
VTNPANAAKAAAAEKLTARIVSGRHGDFAWVGLRDQATTG